MAVNNQTQGRQDAARASTHPYLEYREFINAQFLNNDKRCASHKISTALEKITDIGLDGLVEILCASEQGLIVYLCHL